MILYYILHNYYLLRPCMLATTTQQKWMYQYGNIMAGSVIEVDDMCIPMEMSIHP